MPPPKSRVDSAQQYAVTTHITKVERIGSDYKIFVTVRNDGDKAALLPFHRELSDGSPELWVLAVEQLQSTGEWEYVGTVCDENPAFDFITLKPNEQVETWAIAADFPAENHWYGMCRRKVGHLGSGRVRASLRYYKNPCEVENPIESPVYTSVSGPVDLPGR